MKRLLLFFCFFSVSFFSNAAWKANVEESIFDESNALLVGELNVSSAAALFECEGDDLYFSYIEFTKDSKISDTSANLLFKVDGNDAIKFNGTLRVKNDKAIEVVTTERDGILLALNQLGHAKNKFLIGVNIASVDYKVSRSGNVAASTAAVQQFAKACNLNLKQ